MTKHHYSQIYPQSSTQPTIVSHHNFQSWSLAAMCSPANGSHTPTIQLLYSSHPHFLQHNCIVASCPGQFHESTRFNFLAILTTLLIPWRAPDYLKNTKHWYEFQRLLPQSDLPDLTPSHKKCNSY